MRGRSMVMRNTWRTSGSAVGGLVALVLTAGVVGGGWVAARQPEPEPVRVAAGSPEPTPDRDEVAGSAAPWGRWPDVPVTTTTTAPAPTTTAAPEPTAPPSTEAPAPTRAPRPRPTPTTAPPAPPTTAAPAPPPPPPAEVGTPAQQAMLAQVNAQRTAGRSCGGTWYGPVGALSLSGALSSAATGHALDMATRNFFDHVGSDGSDAGSRMLRAGYGWSAWGENIAAGQPNGTAVIGSWFDSPGHCANFMSPHFTQVGFGQANAPGSAYGTYWAAALAAPR